VVGFYIMSRLSAHSQYPSVSIRMKRYETLEYHYEITTLFVVAPMLLASNLLAADVSLQLPQNLLLKIHHLLDQSTLKL
jgi:hypothetical protein